MNARDWAYAELDIRPGERARPDTADMHVARRRRRQARGYSKKTADDLVAWAEEQDRMAA